MIKWKLWIGDKENCEITYLPYRPTSTLTTIHEPNLDCFAHYV